MDASRIRLFLEKVGDSLVKGNIYHINYEVCETNTDAFYAHRVELIKVIEETSIKEQTETPVSQQNAEFANRQAVFQQIIRQWKKELTISKKRTFFSDYSLDGTGFYLKYYNTFVAADGQTKSDPGSVVVSDGKIMGSFYPDQAQAVIQPATERPQVGLPQWTETAYLFLQNSVTTYMCNYPLLSMKEDGANFVITGDKALEGKERGHSELRIDKSTLKPTELIFLYYNRAGVLHQKLTKTWQYQNVSGLLVPKVVTDQEFKGVGNGVAELEKVRILTINRFDPVPLNTKEEFANLLKSNFSVFDEITGTHYLSGNPGSELDKLSQ